MKASDQNYIKQINTFICILIILLCKVDLSCYAQNNIDEIKANRNKVLKEIEFANTLLEETQGKTEKSINEINILNHKLSKRREYLLGIEMELSIINSSIGDNTENIEDIERENERIKRIYASIIVNLYKNKQSHYNVMYILAADNFNEFYKRITIIKRYNKYLRDQRNILEGFKNELLAKNIELKRLRESKENLVVEQSMENNALKNDLAQKKSIVSELSVKQRNIENEIKEKEQVAKRLENELKRIIDAEMKASSRTNLNSRLTPEEQIISADFEKNIGRLPWPTEQGIVTGKYGDHQHPDYRSVIMHNDGIYISTIKNEEVRAVFKGVVSKVFSIPGENYTVIIKHGEYYTMYHNLINVKVKSGEEVDMKSIIGTVFTNERTNETELQFQIWKETQKKDPELWLAHE